jgi:hypothetical protein
VDEDLRQRSAIARTATHEFREVLKLVRPEQAVLA